MVPQLQLLNYLLTTGDYSVITTNGLTAENFPQFKKEFNYIYSYFKQYNKIPDSLTFITEFPSFELVDTAGVSVQFLLDKVNTEATRTALITNFNKVRELITTNRIDEALSLYIEGASKVSANKNLEASDLLTDISRYQEYIDKCSDFNKYYVSTGFPELDAILGGWDRTEEYATISARSGVGKTWVLLKSITASVNRGLKVGLYSGEMSANKIGYRFDTLMSHISNGQLTHGNINAANAYKSYLDNLQLDHGDAKFYVLTRDKINGKATVDALRGFIEKYDLDILFIDQHSLLDDSKSSRSAFEAAANISKDIKNLQVTKHIPIITVSQQNRTSIEPGKFAGTENISNSDRIAQDSTTIIFISQENDIMTLHIAKARDGGTGKDLRYAIDLDKGIFEYIVENEEDPEAAIASAQLEQYEPVDNPYSGY